jgi:hypothetical protein
MYYSVDLNPLSNELISLAVHAIDVDGFVVNVVEYSAVAVVIAKSDDPEYNIPPVLIIGARLADAASVLLAATIDFTA